MSKGRKPQKHPPAGEDMKKIARYISSNKQMRTGNQFLAAIIVLSIFVIPGTARTEDKAAQDGRKAVTQPDKDFDQRAV